MGYRLECRFSPASGVLLLPGHEVRRPDLIQEELAEARDGDFAVGATCYADEVRTHE